MKVVFFLFAVGTCQVTWKGKSGKMVGHFRLVLPVGHNYLMTWQFLMDESRRSLVGPSSSNDSPLFEPSTLIPTLILGKFKS